MNRNMVMRAVMVAVLFLGMVGLLRPAPVSAEIRFGTVPRLSAAELQAMYAPLLEYLAKETGEKMSLVVPKDFEGVKTAAKNGQMEIGLPISRR